MTLRRAAGYLLLALLLYAAAAAWGGRADAVIVDELLAVVDGQTIALSDLVRFRLITGPDVQADLLLQRMINHIIVLKEVQRFENEPPPPEQVRRAVDELRRRYGDDAAWTARLTQLHLTPESVEQLVRRQLWVELFLTQRVDVFVFVSTVEIEAAYNADPERFGGKPLAEVEPIIEKEIQQRKIDEKRRDYLARLRSKSTIQMIADVPSDAAGLP